MPRWSSVGLASCRRKPPLRRPSSPRVTVYRFQAAQNYTGLGACAQARQKSERAFACGGRWELHKIARRPAYLLGGIIVMMVAHLSPGVQGLASWDGTPSEANRAPSCGHLTSGLEPQSSAPPSRWAVAQPFLGPEAREPSSPGAMIAFLFLPARFGSGFLRGQLRLDDGPGVLGRLDVVRIGRGCSIAGGDIAIGQRSHRRGCARQRR